MSVIISLQGDSKIEVERVSESKQVGIYLTTDESSDEGMISTCVFIPKEWVGSLIAALEDEAGV